LHNVLNPVAPAVQSARNSAANHVANFVPIPAPAPVSLKIAHNDLLAANKVTALTADLAKIEAVSRKASPVIVPSNPHGATNPNADRAPLASIVKQHQAVPLRVQTGFNTLIAAPPPAPPTSSVPKGQNQAVPSALVESAPMPPKVSRLESDSRFARRKRASKASQPVHQTAKAAVHFHPAADHAPDKVAVLQLLEPRKDGRRNSIAIDRNAPNSVQASTEIESSVPASIAPRPPERNRVRPRLRTRTIQDVLIAHHPVPDPAVSLVQTPAEGSPPAQNRELVAPLSVVVPPRGPAESPVVDMVANRVVERAGSADPDKLSALDLELLHVMPMLLPLIH
jgi:hypothetical protein